MRADLLALGHEDLELYSNKGTVRRAASECQSGDPGIAEYQEEGGDLHFSWTDGTICTFPAKKDLRAATCNCSSSTVCRHIIRSVLYYQLLQKSKISNTENPSAAESNAVNDNISSDRSQSPTEPPAEQERPVFQNRNLKQQIPAIETDSNPWNPGDISDELLAIHCKPSVLKKAQALFKSGQLARLYFGRRPSARFISISHTVRFIVPNDVRYAVCDCRDEAPCAHAVLAVLCFRTVPLTSPGVLVECGDEHLSRRDWLMKCGLEDALTDLFSYGFKSESAMAQVVRQILRLKQEAQSNGAFFIVELLEEILSLKEQQGSGDALFSPEDLAVRFAELLCRIDACSGREEATKHVPEALLLGGKWNAPTLIKTLKLTGIGCLINTGKKTTDLSAFAVTSGSGEVVEIKKVVANDLSAKELVSFYDIAKRQAAKTLAFGAMAVSNLRLSSGKMTAARQVSFMQGHLVATPQSFDWKGFGSSVYHDSVEELQQSLTDEFPQYLSQRSDTLAIRVFQPTAVSKPSFFALDHILHCSLFDSEGQAAQLALPYRTRGARGYLLTAKLLSDQAYRLLYVSGLWTQGNAGLRVRPTALIFEYDGEQCMLQPETGYTTGPIQLPGESDRIPGDRSALEFSATNNRPLPSSDLLRTLGAMMVKGILRPDTVDLRQLSVQQRECESGLSQLLGPSIEKLLNAYKHLTDDCQGGGGLQETIKANFKVLLVLGFIIEAGSG